MSLRAGRGFGLVIVLALLGVLTLPDPTAAQYFGRQKVQYEDFDWRIMDTEKFKIHYYDEEEAVTRDAGRMAERWYTRLSAAFQHEFDEKPIVFYADHGDFQQTNVTGGMIGEGTGGFTDALRNRIVMPFTGSYEDNDHVLGHEMVHVFQYDLASSPAGGGLAGMNRLPLWLIEGMAEYLSVGRHDPHTAMWMRDAALRGELPTIQQLGRDPRFFPYRYGQAMWAYVAGRWGDRSITELYRVSTRVGFEAALQQVLGITSEQLSQEWITSIRATYLPLIEGRQRPQDAGDPILVDDEIGAMNLSPVVSPDGRFVAFFGRREIFTVDLYVADARTGEIVETLTTPDRNAHFDALSFIQSAGSWSPDGTKFAFIGFQEGDNRIAILDVASQNVERRFDVQGVGAVSTLAWSPDGRSIAFSGQAGGLSDLYVLELASGSVRQLTDDRSADIHPTWSPDSRSIAFSTDRDGTDFDRLTYGNMELAIIDVATSQIRTLDLFADAKHINPAYSPDGNSIFFIADRNGFSDIYRYAFDTGTVYQITRLATGVSGITDLSPAMSVASQDGRLMFSVFMNSGSNIFGLDAERTVGQPVSTTEPQVAAAGLLPPIEAIDDGPVAAYLEDALTGLPGTGDFETRDYSPSISLEYLGPPSFGVGVSNYGTGLTGGVSAFFGDMLGNHMIGAAVQAQGTLKDVGGQAVYLNAENRLNWGVSAGHIPYLTGFARRTAADLNGQIVPAQDIVLERIFIDQLQLLTRYPFSQTQRVELSGGYTRYSFDREVHRTYYNQFFQPIAFERFDTTSADALGLWEASAALVGDNSFFGLTSPVVGQRYRFEVSPTFGTLTYQTLLADYRRYFFSRPFTFAFRGLHYGRYGSDSGTNRLSPLFLGSEYFIRGYEWGSFDGSECTVVEDETDLPCPEFDRLFGSRIGVASVEFRIPLIGVEELGLINFPFVPVEVSPFIDAGVAWNGGDTPSFEFARRSVDRIPVFSAGVSARMNIFGYIVLESYWAYPFQRPQKGGHFGFQLAPGW
jgi:Tol biopolymer transport system component